MSTNNYYDFRYASKPYSTIPAKYYADQPYIIKTDDGAWLCTMTTNANPEGQKGQYVLSMRSTDIGKSWSDSVMLEPDDERENSYSVLYKTPYGRIYCFYNHNTDNIRKVKADDPPYEGGYCNRVDSLGYYVFKYSDDHGRSWSKDRYPIDVREFDIDRNNAYSGAVRFFWNVGKPFVLQNDLFVSLHKVGGIGYGFFTSSEGVLLKSSNISHEKDPHKIIWETLPDGDTGLRTPKNGGPISEEHSYSVLSDGSIYSVYRSIDGYPVEAYSYDFARTWSEPRYKRYASGRLMKHPRAANFVWALNNGMYLYWFHNNGGRNYDDRNPAWVSAGMEQDTERGREIMWAEPEILLYEDDSYLRMSYPDLIEDEGNVFITETNKNEARIHKIDKVFLQKLFNQFTINNVCQQDLILDYVAKGKEEQKEQKEEKEEKEKKEDLGIYIQMPKLNVFTIKNPLDPDHGQVNTRAGVSMDLWIQFDKITPQTILLDNMSDSGAGFLLKTVDNNTIELVMSDGRSGCFWTLDKNILQEGSLHHIALVIDAGPNIITCIVDGKLLDGGVDRQFGWGRFSKDLRSINGAGALCIRKSNSFDIKAFRIYDRALMTSEMIGNFRAGI